MITDTKELSSKQILDLFLKGQILPSKRDFPNEVLARAIAEVFLEKIKLIYPSAEIRKSYDWDMGTYCNGFSILVSTPIKRGFFESLMCFPSESIKKIAFCGDEKIKIFVSNSELVPICDDMVKDYQEKIGLCFSLNR